MRVIKIIFLLVLGASSSALLAQSKPDRDAGQWTTLTIQHEIKDRLTLSIDEEFRLKENYTRVNLFYTNVGLAFKLGKRWKIEPSIRHIDKVNLDGTVSFRNRFMLDVNFKTKISNFTITQRLRFQSELKDYYSSELGKIPEEYLRYKVGIAYENDSKFTPYISCELRYQIDVPGKDSQYNGIWHRVRSIAGLEYKINKKNSINLYYLVQNEYNIAPPEDIYITGLQYSIKL